MRLLRSIRKNWKLSRIMTRLAAPLSPSEMIAGMMSGTVSPKDKARQDLFALVLGDPDLRDIMKNHGATRTTIEEAYSSLMLAGAGQWAGGAYVAAAAVATNSTLDYLLSAAVVELPPQMSESDRWRRISFELISYFETGRLGQVGM